MIIAGTFFFSSQSPRGTVYQQQFFQNIENRWRIFFLKFHYFQEIVETIFFENFPPAFFNILREPLLLQKQTIHQQKGLDLSFLQTQILRAWHDQEGATPSRREKHRCAWGKKSYFTASHPHALMIVPCPCPSGSKQLKSRAIWTLKEKGGALS